MPPEHSAAPQPLQVRPMAPSDFPALRAFDVAPLSPLGDAVLRMFTVFCTPLGFVLDTRAQSLAGLALAMLSVDRRTAYLHYLVVAGPWRGQGWGRRLLRAGEDAPAALGARQTMLYTTRAVAYYTRQGYRRAPWVVRGEEIAYNAPHGSGQYLSKGVDGAALPEVSR